MLTEELPMTTTKLLIGGVERVDELARVHVVRVEPHDRTLPQLTQYNFSQVRLGDIVRLGKRPVLCKQTRQNQIFNLVHSSFSLRHCTCERKKSRMTGGAVNSTRCS